MKDNRINENFLLKNIEFLRLYNGEEKTKLNSIFDKFKNCQNCYKTSNSLTLSNKINSLNNNLPTLFANRNSYVDVLDNVVKRYREMAQAFVLSAKKMEGDSNDSN